MSSTSTDYYKSLGLEKDSTVAQIKCAYRRLVLIYHPDKNGGSVRAEEKFKLLQNAYETLVDPKRRKWYDARSQPQSQSHYNPDTEFYWEAYYAPRATQRRWQSPSNPCSAIHEREDCFGKRSPWSPKELNLRREESAIKEARKVLKEWWNNQSFYPGHREAIKRKQEICIERNVRLMRMMRVKINERERVSCSYEYLNAHREVVELWNEQWGLSKEMKRILGVMKREEQGDDE